MIAILLLAGGVCMILTALVAFFIYKSQASKTVAPGTGGSLKDELPDVISVVKGELATDIIASGYFAGVYPGVQVVTSRASLPTTTPAFLLLTDATGTITGVEANSVLWSGPSDAAPVAATVKPTVKPTRKPKK